MHRGVMNHEVLIAGAGIGGLAAALSLHAAGVQATVIESAHELQPLGVGINLLPHAVKALTELGLGDQVARLGVSNKEIAHCDGEGNILYAEPRGVDGGYGHPQYSVHRGELQLLLYRTVVERLGARAVRLGTRLRRFAQDHAGVRVEAQGEEFAAEVLVGADGVHSAVRAQLHPDEGPLRWSGVRMWRGAAEIGSFLSGRTMVVGHAGGDCELVVYPISDRVVNWVALARVGAPGALPDEARWNSPAPAADALERFADWNLGWLDVAAMIEKTTRIVEYPMVDRDPLPRWGEGRVTLLGDAAHPMYPLGANGGSQSIVDGAALATELSLDSPGGLVRYEAARRPATSAIVLANRAMLRGWDARTPHEVETVAAEYRRETRA